MAVREIHQGDIGTSFELTFLDGTDVVDISDNTSILIIFQKPNGTVEQQVGSLVTDGTDGKAHYVTTSVNDLDQIGSWRIQGKVTLPTGTWSSDISKFKVYRNLA